MPIKFKPTQAIYVYHCQLIKVTDGDTLWAYIDKGFDDTSKRKIRLTNVDAYEARGEFYDYRGPLATKFVQELFAQQGPDFYLHSDRDEIVSYNRVGGRIYLPYEHPETGSGFIDLGASLKACGYDKHTTPSHGGEFDPTFRELAAIPAEDIMDIVLRRVKSDRHSDAIAGRITRE